MIREERAHFRRTFEIKLRHIAHPFLVVHHLAGADADHDVVRFVMAALEKMDIVRRHQPEPKLVPDGRQDGIAFPLRFEAVIVQLEKEIFRPQNVAKGRRAGSRFVELIGLDRHVDLALETGAHPDQSLAMRREQLAIDPRFVMHPLEMRSRHQLHEIAITSLVAGQEREMVSRIALRIRAVLDRARRHVSLDSDNRFDPGIGRRLIEFHCAMEVAVIGHGNGRHLHFGRFFHQLLHPHRPIEERIFGVEMEMNEGIGGHATSL